MSATRPQGGVLTTEPPATPNDATPASTLTKPLREIAALVLLGATAVFLFVALIDLIIPVDFDNNDFSDRSANSFGRFVNLTIVGLPLLAVLLANHVRPAVGRAKLITLVALLEYAVAAFFGVIFGLLVGVVEIISDDSARAGLEAFLTRVAWLALLGMAAYALVVVGRGLYWVPKPPAQPAGYGYPQGYQQGYGQQQQPYGYGQQQPPYGYGQQPGYPQQQPYQTGYATPTPPPTSVPPAPPVAQTSVPPAPVFPPNPPAPPPPPGGAATTQPVEPPSPEETHRHTPPASGSGDDPTQQFRR